MIEGEKARGGSSWSRDDDIAFETALAVHIEETDNRWKKITDALPGKTLEEVKEKYENLLHDIMMIESGDTPLPDYDLSKETNLRERSIQDRGVDKQEDEPKSKPNRRKASPWTPLEHSQFLLGLEKYGKGDWRSISRHFVLTRTPTQVASHAQKYYERLKSKNKSKQRKSIHDFNVAESSNISAMKAPITWQDARATSQPSLLNHHAYEAPTMWNTQATSQSSLDHHVSGTHTIPSANVPVYGTPTIGQSRVGPHALPYGTDVNLVAPPRMAYQVQHHSGHYSPVPSAPFNIGPVPYTMTNIPTSR